MSMVYEVYELFEQVKKHIKVIKVDGVNVTIGCPDIKHSENLEFGTSKISPGIKLLKPRKPLFTNAISGQHTGCDDGRPQRGVS